jgi:hypothetical protein
VPKADILRREKMSLFDHLVGALVALERNVDADYLCGLEVDPRSNFAINPARAWGCSFVVR